MPDEPRIDANEHERKHWDLCHQIVGVFYPVYNELGYGFLEAVYEEALAIGLTEAGMHVARQSKKGIRVHSRVFAAK
jgi:GxxExxY protein